jgi:hypothetical protein
MLYIVGASGMYIGRYAVGISALGAACLLALVFRRYLGRYLDTLDARAGGDEDQDEDQDEDRDQDQDVATKAEGP